MQMAAPDIRKLQLATCARLVRATTHDYCIGMLVHCSSVLVPIEHVNIILLSRENIVQFKAHHTDYTTPSNSIQCT
ncbi:hypothetical protein T02_3983 [Trichinella nativa]|uniref:Uncharacterized protein n=1 Tax=Trichinella nativa TaxID=6335 RepID=A0A0V1L831_9BILA|nr:hypothetical protein T02_3983 [Trichinella nativa]